MKTFQQPLTAGEEAYYIRLLREGTVEEAIQAKEILVERNLRLVAHIAKKIPECGRRYGGPDLHRMYRTDQSSEFFSIPEKAGWLRMPVVVSIMNF